MLSLDFYAILGLYPGASRESVNRACEKCLNNPPDLGFSSQAIAARASVLQGALETLVSAAARREYDQRYQLGELSENVPSDYIAGVLMLLQEAGEAQTVVAVGEAWLANHRRHKSARDVALVTALAQCDLAKAFLESRGSVDRVCRALEVAAKLLKQCTHGSTDLSGSGQFLTKIEDTVQELRPRRALELLSSADQGLRAQGLQILPIAIEAIRGDRSEGTGHLTGTTQGSTRVGNPLSQFMETLRGVLTADEYVEFSQMAAGDVALETPDLCYIAAVAHIAAGAAHRRPSIIRRAAELLRRADEIAVEEQKSTITDGVSTASPLTVRARRAVDGRHRRVVAAAVAALLLGDSAAAGEALGLRDGRLKCDRQVFAFIRANSPDQANLLPGVCVLVERWVSDVAMTAFRGGDFINTNGAANEMSFSLNAWFDDPAVLRELENSGGDIVGLFSRIYNALAAPIHAVMSLFITARGGISNRQKEAAMEATELPDEQRIVGSSQSMRQVVVDSVNDEASSIQTTMTHQNKHPLQDRQLLRASVDSTDDQQIYKPELREPEEDPFSLDHQNDGDLLKDVLDDDDNGFLVEPVALEAIKPLRGEDAWMVRVYEARQIRWERVVAAASVLTALLYTAVRMYMPGVAPFSTLPRTDTPISAVSVGDDAISSTGLSYKEASSLIHRWQKVKSAALGAQHAMTELPLVLEGDLLAQWSDRANTLKANGWHYAHRLYNCKVLRVDPGSTANTATITAAFKEVVTVQKGLSSAPQTFTSEYEVTYTARQHSQGTWVLNSAQVKSPHASRA